MFKVLKMKTTGRVLFLIGILMIVFQWINEPLKKGNIDSGPVQIMENESSWIGWPTYAGAVLSVAGIIIVAICEKKGKE